MIVVPQHLITKFGKREIWCSLKTREKRIAIERAGEKVGYYNRLFYYDTITDDVEPSFYDAKSAADRMGFPYTGSAKLEALSFKESIQKLCERLNALQELAKPDRAEVAALSGAVEEGLSLDKLLERYKELMTGKWSELNERERQKKWNPFPAAIREFKKEIGDIDTLKITTTDASNFAVKLDRRIEKARKEGGKFGYEAARKTLMRLRMMCDRVFKADFPRNENPFAGIKIESSKNKQKRAPFTEKEVAAIETAMATSGINDELKAIIAILANTGARPKEICLLAREDIVLDHAIPHILIRANENRKTLKTESSVRAVPLIGAALEAAKRFPNGFPRYCRPLGSEAFSSTANQLFKSIGISKTTYCYRHRFIDLLRESGSPDSRTMSIVGHTNDREKTTTDGYGKGASLNNRKMAIVAALEYKSIRAKDEETENE